MTPIKVNDTVLVDHQGREVSGLVLKVESEGAEVYCPKLDLVQSFPFGRLRRVPPLELRADQVRALFRYETRFSKLAGSHTAFAVPVFLERCVLTLEDLLAAMENISKSRAKAETIYDQWFWPLCNWLEWSEGMVSFEDDPEDVENLEFLPTRGGLMDAILSEDVDAMLREWDGDYKASIPGITQRIREHIHRERLPLTQRQYTVEEMEHYVRNMDDPLRIRQASPVQLELLRRFTYELCNEESVVGMECKAYGHYGGNAVFPCDWDESLACLNWLYEATGDPKYANSMGYIYYYGRCWDGKPRYAEAFRYFSIGAAAGYYESRYKLADMFLNGQGVPKNAGTAVHIIEELYRENVRYIMDGCFDCKFADVALRAGILAEDGYGQWDVDDAYCFYLQAEFAIRQRLPMEYYGDDAVAERINWLLTRLWDEKKAEAPVKTASVHLEELLGLYLRGYRKLQLTGRAYKNGDLKLSIRIAPHEDEKYPPKLFITEPKTGFCGLLEELEVRVRGGGLQGVDDLSRPMYFDGIALRYEEEGDGLILKLGDETRAVLTGDVQFTSPAVREEKKHLFAVVTFTPCGKRYDYLLDREDIVPGDYVLVENDKHPEGAEAFVLEVKEKSAHELALPLGRYKRVLGKVEGPT